ncbi:MAG: VOC family protein [Microbacteriaceae bacterium]|nr:VOC family protein [Microbacteriaceae bacterium]MDR9443603.1 VOC family protein [Microbacteriaceae bacterium]
MTAIAADPQKNVDFYTKTLGLRLVKQTVNFDAPHVWHLYYGDEKGSPASILTFFPWPGVIPGKEGAGLTTATSFSVPLESIGFWEQRLKTLGVESERSQNINGFEFLKLRDQDGMSVELVGTEGDARSGWDGEASIPAEHAIRGLHSVTLSQQLLDPTAIMLTDMLGMQANAESPSAAQFAMADGATGTLVDVLPGVRDRGLQAGGTVHHVAFRAPNLSTMENWREQLVSQGVPVTEIMDRQYFKSIYFREPGGVLFEIATDDPGFDIDEPLLELGKKLKLPPWLEPDREQIAHNLPRIEA